jgi:hypothetical protein
MSTRKLTRAEVVGRILGLSALGGLGLGAVALLSSVIGMIPAYQHGRTGMFGIGFGIVIQGIFYFGAGIPVGVLIGLVVAGIWWMARGRFMPRSHRDGENATPYPVPPV